ncbi:hypothetical protein [Bacillus sp. B15-48]|uniref:hypothetical protein n=1 Tax=Bacillus sp. B15-48 TaxID=1548601 RepID=UPI00193F3CE3|nr:hypothetical protein [Bacillus sp. B15-48]MBM4762687.1 hypothetical protein [Bacillus sp. B15-48]
MRTEVISFNEFVTDGYKGGNSTKYKKGNLKELLKASVTIPFVWDALKGSKTFAREAVEVGTVPQATKESILHAFDPLIELMIDLALPIAGVMITGGALLILIGQKDKGFQLILNSSLGYCLVQLTPLLLKLLEQVGKSI